MLPFPESRVVDTRGRRVSCERNVVHDVRVSNIVSCAFDQVQYAAPGRVDKYLAGLLWNLQTYQDGVCADYGYNYGRRMSPTATEIVDYLKEAMKENRTVGRRELLDDTFTPAVSAGISCLAALPSQMQDLIPKPYSLLSNTTVEDIYASCMDPEDNCFDIKQFELFCMDRIREVNGQADAEVSVDEQLQVEKHDEHGRRILTGDRYWIVLARQKSPLTHPFEPPRPFSDRLSKLRPNRLLKASRRMATAEPRPRSAWSTSNSQEKRDYEHEKVRILRRRSREVKHADIGDLLKTHDGSEMSVLNVEYMRAFPEFQRQKKKKPKKRMQFDLNPIPRKTAFEVNGKPTSKKHRRDFDVAARMRKYKLDFPPDEIPTNPEGYTPLLLLNQLSAAKMIGDIQWTCTLPSRSSYASVDPQTHEHVQLVVKKGPKKDTKTILFEELTYEQDRDINHMSRQRLKQHLSSLALCDIIGPRKRWSEMNFWQLKDYLLQQRNEKKSSKEA